VGRLAVVLDGEPDIFPVNFAVVDKRIVIRTAPGPKLNGALTGPSVAFEADVLDLARHTGWSVVARGPAAQPENLGVYIEALDMGVQPWAAGRRDRFIVITPTSITGRVLGPAATGHVW